MVYDNLNNDFQNDKPPHNPFNPPPKTPSPDTVNNEILSESPVEEITALSGIGQLFSRAWELFLKRVWTILSILSLSLLMGLGIFLVLALMLILTGNSPIVTPLVFICGFIGISIVNLWAQTAFFTAIVNEDIGVKESFGLAWPRIGSFLWVNSLIGLIVMGGFLLFFVPGIIFAIWFSFAVFILIQEDLRGVDALAKSKFYVKGRTLPIFGRFFILLILSILTNIIPIPVVREIILGLFSLYCVFCTYIIYQDLQALKDIGDFFESRDEQRRSVTSLAMISIVFPVILASLIIWKAQDIKSNMPSTVRSAFVKSMQFMNKMGTERKNGAFFIKPQKSFQGSIKTISFGQGEHSVELIVTGIIFGNPTAAIVNGEVLKEGDKISGVTVYEITPNMVKFQLPDGRFTVVDFTPVE